MKSRRKCVVVSLVVVTLLFVSPHSLYALGSVSDYWSFNSDTLSENGSNFGAGATTTGGQFGNYNLLNLANMINRSLATGITLNGGWSVSYWVEDKSGNTDFFFRGKYSTGSLLVDSAGDWVTGDIFSSIFPSNITDGTTSAGTLLNVFNAWSTSDFQSSGFHHFVIVFSDTDINAYLDDSLVYSADYTNTLSFSGKTLTNFLALEDGNGSGVGLDDFTVWGFPLTPEQVSFLYSEGELGDNYLLPHIGNITATTTWGGNQVHVIQGNVTVDPGITLTINPGAVVKFDTATTSSLTVNGILIAEGEDEHVGKPIFFTSLKDDLIGNDTNNDAASTTPATGDWAGIEVNSDASASLAHVIVRYGGSVDGSGAMLYNNGGSLIISTSTIVYGSNYGIKNSSGTTTITASDVGFNDYGLYLDGGSITITATSTIHDNITFGAFNNTTATSSLFAENNYWATSSATTTGPYNSRYNSGGTGNAVSDYIDFDPWLGKAGVTSLPHYVTKETFPGCVSFDLCWSVTNGQLLLDASATPYIIETNAATSTWNSENKIEITAPTSTPADLIIYATSTADTWSKGWWEPIHLASDFLYLNTYYLDQSTTAQRQNTITHELGHALGLDHSYTGNIMFLGQSDQTSLGPQDVFDYEYLWP